jgi:hypothetical protein
MLGSPLPFIAIATQLVAQQRVGAFCALIANV